MTTLFDDPSLVGLAPQSAGVLMIAVLCLRVDPHDSAPAARAVDGPALIALFISLMTLLLAFRRAALRVRVYSVYMFFEYVFAYLVFAGSREYATGRAVGVSDWPVGPACWCPRSRCHSRPAGSSMCSLPCTPGFTAICFFCHGANSAAPVAASAARQDCWSPAWRCCCCRSPISRTDCSLRSRAIGWIPHEPRFCVLAVFSFVAVDEDVSALAWSWWRRARCSQISKRRAIAWRRGADRSPYLGVQSLRVSRLARP